MTGLRIKESNKGTLTLIHDKRVQDRIDDYAFSDELRKLCESICKFRGVTKYGDIRIRSVVRWPGRSIDLCVHNRRVFEAGHFLLSGSLVYARLNKKLITLQLIHKLTSIHNKIFCRKNSRTS